MKTKLIPILLVIAPLLSRGAERDPEAITALANGTVTFSSTAEGERLLKEYPNNHTLLLAQSMNLLGIGDGETAISILNRLAQQSQETQTALPDDFSLRMAQAHFQIGDYDAAAKFLRESLAKKNCALPANALALLWGLAAPYEKWILIETAHLRLHFSPGITSEEERKGFAVTRENAFAQIDRFFHATLPKKIDVIVWKNNDEAKRTANIKFLGFSTPRDCLIHTAYDQTRGHELTHVISYRAVRPEPKTLLINEGIAIHFDLTRRDRIALARDAVRNSKGGAISIVALWTASDRSTPDSLLYPVAGAFVEQLHKKGGDEKFLRLCANQTYAAAQEIYGVELSTWIAEFEKEINPPDKRSKN